MFDAAGLFMQRNSVTGRAKRNRIARIPLAAAAVDTTLLTQSITIIDGAQLR